MKKSYKNWLFILIVIFFLIGCQDNKLKDSINDKVNNNTYSVIYNDLNNLINQIKMFPSRNNEEEFIYYIKAIKDNHTKFTSDELSSISNLLDFNYQFSFNKLDYDTNDFYNDKQIINGYVN